jgi:hypothetical protein
MFSLYLTHKFNIGKKNYMKRAMSIKRSRTPRENTLKFSHHKPEILPYLHKTPN